MPAANCILPPADIHITIGANLDPTLKPAHRERYYCCLLFSEEEPFAAIRDDPDFLLPPYFQDAETDQPGDGALIEGPFRWLLEQLLQFERVLLWPAARNPSSEPTGFDQPHLLDDLPRLRARLPTDSKALADVGVVVLDLAIAEDCRLLWEVANLVSSSSEDWYVSDADCLEVYLMHHHDKVVVSIPDKDRRDEVLLELDDLSDLIEDCSGYGSAWDDEDEEE
jgi:hypothetical protein